MTPVTNATPLAEVKFSQNFQRIFNRTFSQAKPSPVIVKPVKPPPFPPEHYLLSKQELIDNDFPIDNIDVSSVYQVPASNSEHEIFKVKNLN